LKYLRLKNPRLSLTGIDLRINERIPGVDLIEANIGTWQYHHQFDVVVSLAAIEHVVDVQNFMKLAEMLCSADGLVIIMTVNERSIVYELARLANIMGYRYPFEHLYSKHHLNHFNISSLKRLVMSMGFKIVKSVPYNPPVASLDTGTNSAAANAALRSCAGMAFRLGKLMRSMFFQIVVCKRSAG